jgi:NAD(P)-dependent dehydrogenase (short-subunit alcohol dehydrogenase family)
MTSPFDGKIAIVTGGSRGIGLAIATALATRGVSVTICGVDAAHLSNAETRLAKVASSDRVQTCRADVRDYGHVQKLVETTVQRFGGLDIIVNNAAIGRFALIAETSPEDWRAMIETNLTGVFHCCHAALPHLRKRGGGWIINISSLSATHPFAGAAGYSASKAGLNAFTEALMQEVRQDDIRVSCILPGSVGTGFGGHGVADWKLAPEDVAQVVVDLLEYPRRSLPSRIEIRPSKPRK